MRSKECTGVRVYSANLLLLTEDREPSVSTSTSSTRDSQCLQPCTLGMSKRTTRCSQLRAIDMLPPGLMEESSNNLCKRYTTRPDAAVPAPPRDEGVVLSNVAV